MKSYTIIPSSKDIDNVQDVATQFEQESPQQTYEGLEEKLKILNKFFVNKDEEIVQTQKK
jgi:hypothetical protein